MIIIGGASSNNVPALTQIMIQNGITPLLMLKKGHAPNTVGNPLTTHLLVPDENIRWLDHLAWKDVHQRATSLSEALSGRGDKTFVVPEGALCEPSLPGAMTLMDDILRDEKKHNLTFDHIYIDAGTGMSASGLILGNNFIEKPKKINVCLVAGNSNSFHIQLDRNLIWLNKLSKYKTEQKTPPNLFQPSNGASFGSVNQSTLKFIRDFARYSGILTDPIYSAKLFMETELQLQQKDPMGNILIIHSGGIQSLHGFGNKLNQLT